MVMIRDTTFFISSLPFTRAKQRRSIMFAAAERERNPNLLMTPEDIVIQFSRRILPQCIQS